MSYEQGLDTTEKLLTDYASKVVNIPVLGASEYEQARVAHGLEVYERAKHLIDEGDSEAARAILTNGREQSRSTHRKPQRPDGIRVSDNSNEGSVSRGNDRSRNLVLASLVGAGGVLISMVTFLNHDYDRAMAVEDQNIKAHSLQIADQMQRDGFKGEPSGLYVDSSHRNINSDSETYYMLADTVGSRETIPVIANLGDCTIKLSAELSASNNTVHDIRTYTYVATPGGAELHIQNEAGLEKTFGPDVCQQIIHPAP